MRCYIGFDLGGSSMKTGIVTENAEVLAHQKYPIPDSFEALLDLLEQLTRKAMAEYGVLGAAISSAGCTDPADGTVHGWMAPSLLYLRGRNFYDLRPRLSIPVRAEKRVAAALGEYWAGEAKGCEFPDAGAGHRPGGRNFPKRETLPWQPLFRWGHGVCLAGGGDAGVLPADGTCAL